MIKKFRSKTILVVLCAFFSAPAHSDNIKDALSVVASNALPTKNAAEALFFIKEFRDGDVEEFFDNTNTIAWDLVLPLVAAYYSAQACASNAYNSSSTMLSKVTALTQGTLAAVVGGGAAYILSSIPKKLLKKLCQHFVEAKKTVAEIVE